MGKRTQLTGLLYAAAALLSALLLAGCSVNPEAINAQWNPPGNYRAKKATVDPEIYLHYSGGIRAGVYGWIPGGDGSYYMLVSLDKDGKPVMAPQKEINVGAGSRERLPADMAARVREEVPAGVYVNANVTHPEYQRMLVCVPAEYLKLDEEGRVIGIDHKGAKGQYTADTAPIIFANECGGWRSGAPRSPDRSFLDEGMIYVSAGARGRDADGGRGKAPASVVDLKSGLMALRANGDIIPGDKERIVSLGTSGGGQMSALLAATGGDPLYHRYLYEAGAPGVERIWTGDYLVGNGDYVYAAQCYCPITDIANADLAYAWMWAELPEAGGEGGKPLTPFEKRLQELMAEGFVSYVNGLELKAGDWRPLSLTGLRKGSYYDLLLEEISRALNAAAEAGEADPARDYPDSGGWLEQKDGAWRVTDLTGFMKASGLAAKRNKAAPGYDPMDKSAENDAFGRPGEKAVHFSAGVADILKNNYDELSRLEGFDAKEVKTYIREARRRDVIRQTELMDPLVHLLGKKRYFTPRPATHVRIVSGTADEHASFTLG
ncbi:MAG: hypothetical protein IK083_04540, partial [Abditibacteriota bacterium]|nr:hypothetical protein [Abditibacteriota bacterium]